MNPFSLPAADPELYLQRERQRSVERSITVEQRLVPIHLRRAKNTYTMLDELRNSNLNTSHFERSRRTKSCNRENIHELILRKREILLTKKKIEHKKLNISLLDDLSKTREEEQKKIAKAIEDNLLMFEKYEEKLKTEAKAKADLAEKKIKERIEKQVKINSLEQDIERLYAKIDRRTEEIRQLCVLKAFVEELSSIQDIGKSTTFITDKKEESYTPSSLLKSINSLEQKNLFLIQQAQEVESNLDVQRSKSSAEFNLLITESDQIKNNIRSLEKSKELLMSKYDHILNETVEEPLINESTMSQLHSSLGEFFMMIGGDPSTQPTDFEILERLENSIRAEIDKTKLMDEETLKSKEKDVEKARRFKNVDTQKAKELEKAKKVSEKMQKRKEKTLKKLGRKGMMRSKIPEKEVVAEVVEVPQEILDRREFLEEFIPFP